MVRVFFIYVPRIQTELPMKGYKMYLCDGEGTFSFTEEADKATLFKDKEEAMNCISWLNKKVQWQVEDVEIEAIGEGGEDQNAV